MDIKKIKVGQNTYNIKDEVARDAIQSNLITEVEVSVDGGLA